VRISNSPIERKMASRWRGVDWVILALRRGFSEPEGQRLTKFFRQPRAGNGAN
jgi:hypothetical protein